MQEQDNTSFFTKANNWARNSITLKLLVIGILILLMLIPVSMVEDLIRERSYRKNDAYNEVSATWGGSQTIGGPVLVIPIEETSRVVDEDADDGFRLVTTRRYVNVLPDVLDYNGRMPSEIKKRGIYELILYQANVDLNGSFPIPDPKSLSPDANILWDRAIVAMSITELKALKEQVELSINGQPLDFQPGVDICASFSNGVHARIDLTELKDTALSFQGNLQFRGSKSLSMLPLGKETTAKIESDWATPKFYGSFLPHTHSFNESGLVGEWKVLDLNRNYPQSFIGTRTNIQGSDFAVELFQKLDHYGLNQRAAKYAVLIIALIFVAFFFMQVIFKKRVHAIQFLLVGLSLTLFYTLLLSFSEHIGFNKAYLISAAVIVIMNAFYIKAIFSRTKPALIGGAIILILYLFIFVILQMEDFALLTGSIGLLLVLSYAMYLTRNIDWFSKDESEKPLTQS